MNFAAWLRSHRRSLLVLVVLVAVAGGITASRLPVALFPYVEFPTIAVDLEAGDRPAERTANEVTGPVEQALRGVRGVRSLRSTTSRGTAEITVGFAWGDDLEAAQARVESTLTRTTGQMTGVRYELRRKEPDLFPVVAYSITSATRSPDDLRRWASTDLRPLLITVPGVARIDLQGGSPAEWHVVLDPVRLATREVSADEVSTALSSAGAQSIAGRLQDGGTLSLVVVDACLLTRDDLLAVPVRAGANGLVRVRDVATVEAAATPEWTRCTADGQPAVLVQVFQQPGGNTVALAAGLTQALAAAGTHLPADIHMATWYDQSQLIVASASSVRDAVIIGTLLAIVVLFAFLRQWKITLVAAIVVPTVLASTALVLGLLHQGFNIMTLGGIAAAVGLIVDDAIVMVEHLLHRLRERHTHAAGSVEDSLLVAAAEFTRPMLGSSLSTMVIFAPMAFLSGVTGAFFQVLSLTMAVALVISFLVAWIAVPLAASRLLTVADAQVDDQGAIARWLSRSYVACMRRLLPRPWLLPLLIAPLLTLGWFAYHHVGQAFMPVMDEGGFILDYVAAPGSSLAETDRLVRQMEAILSKVPEVQTWSRRTGLQLGGGLTEAHAGDLFVRLKPSPRRSIDAVMDDVRDRITQHVPGLAIETAQLIEDMIGDLTGGDPHPIEIELSGGDEATLRRTAAQVVTAITAVSGVVDVKNGLTPAGDAIDLRVDRQRAAMAGITPEAIAAQVSLALAGTVVTALPDVTEPIGVRVRFPHPLTATVPALQRLGLRATDGHLVRLGQVATPSIIAGEPQITRAELRRVVWVTARISGRDLGSVVRDVQTAVAAAGVLAPTVSAHFGGLFAQQQAAYLGLALVLIAALVLEGLLLLFFFERMRIVVALLTTTVLALSGAEAALWLTDVELSITALMGMTMVVGIVTEAGIFLASEFQSLAHIADPLQRLAQAGVNRWRPIVMTTLAAMLALAPLAFGLGEGADMQRPLAIAVIGGLVLQAPLVLVILPMLLGAMRPKSLTERRASV